MTKLITILTSAATFAMAAIPLSAIGSVAHAAEVHVQVADLDLRQPVDAARFQARVDAAARSLCNAPVNDLTAQSACRTAVREEAMEKLGDAQRQDLQVAAASVSPTWRVAGR